MAPDAEDQGQEPSYVSQTDSKNEWSIRPLKRDSPSWMTCTGDFELCRESDLPTAMVHFIYKLAPCVVEIFGQILCWVFLWACFQMTVTFQSIDEVKLIAFPNVGGLYPISEGPNRTKALPLSWSRENSPTFRFGQWLFFCPQTQTETWALSQPWA